ncbi:MAG: DMT family transporter [bacterium]|nr:DMT family transporter [bacterium]
MEDVKEKRKGELFLFSNTFLWAFFPIITVLSYATISGLVSLLWSTTFAALFFAAVITYRKKWSEMNNRVLWKYSALVAFFIGVLYYSLFFLGLETTTPGNAALIALFEVFTSFIFFNVLRGEKVSLDYKIGGVLMVIGAGIVLARNFSGVNYGDVFILAATFCAPAGNLFQQKARAIASSEMIMFLRSVISVPAILFLTYVFHTSSSLEDLKVSLPFLLINGFFLIGLSKIFWVEGIHRVPVAKGVALGGISPILTLLLAWFILHQAPNVWQLTSLVPLLLGVLLLTDHIKLTGGLKRQPASQS